MDIVRYCPHLNSNTCFTSSSFIIYCRHFLRWFFLMPFYGANFSMSLQACQRALELRKRKFKRNATYLKHQLSWKYEFFFRTSYLFLRYCTATRSCSFFLTWTSCNLPHALRFNGHLRKKGISGLIKVNYEEKTLMIEVKLLSVCYMYYLLCPWPCLFLHAIFFLLYFVIIIIFLVK